MYVLVYHFDSPPLICIWSINYFSFFSTNSSTVMWAVIFVQNRLNHISALNGICFCYIRRKNRSHASIVMQHVQPRRYSVLICWAMAVVSRFRAASAARISHENTIWIDIYCTPAVTSRGASMKPPAMCAANCFPERTTFVNIFAHILANRHGSAIISARIALSHFTVRRYSSKWWFIKVKNVPDFHFRK